MISLLAAVVLTTSPASSIPSGVYQSRGYGWVLDRRVSPSRLYQTAGSACWLDARAEPDAVFRHTTQRPDGALAVTSDAEPQATAYVFDAVADLPPQCQEASADASRAVRAIADLMSERYPGFDARRVDFDARRHAILDRLPDTAAPEAAFAAAETLLGGLDDAHIALSADLEGGGRSLAVSQGETLDAIHARPGDRPERVWLGAWRSGVEDTILGGQGHVAANNRIFWGLRDGVGYLAIVTMGGFDPDDAETLAPLDEVLDAAMTAFAHARAVVVDVSNNRGGYDAASLKIAGRFAEAPRLAYLKHGWGSGEPYQPIVVEPSDRPGYHGPVWLLTSDITVSAGETFSQMMRVLPNVTHAGTATRGAFSDQTSVTLPNGWSFAMPMEAYVDPEGRALEGHGLQPRIPLALYPAGDPDRGHARAVSALITRLSRTR